MYFNQNDEQVDEAMASSDPNNYYHKYHVVSHDFKQDCQSDEDDEDIQILEEIVMGGSKGDKASKIVTRMKTTRNKIEKITKDTFYGEKPSENAEIFIETIQKTRKNHLKKV